MYGIVLLSNVFSVDVFMLIFTMSITAVEFLVHDDSKTTLDWVVTLRRIIICVSDLVCLVLFGLAYFFVGVLRRLLVKRDRL